ncbi:hypothetical protein MTR_7g025420 [Medicago truncatula]|uniref:Uncharacterized protein n=1 Tax=Medicago truncatula TaxID=3880 RepID=G7KYX4_MEDTR|nr:hypothetical protein MTR_7g025420 [Medicago truncatula]
MFNWRCCISAGTSSSFQQNSSSVSCFAGLFHEDATWEDYTDIMSTYPDFHLEDKVTFDGVGDVMEQIDIGNWNDELEGMEEQAEAREETIPKLRAKRNAIHK